MFDIITDSTAYFTREMARDLEITIIPMTFTIGDLRYAEGYSGEQKNHIADIEKNMAFCKTSQPNIKVISDAYDRSVKVGRSVLFITMSSRLSGTYNSAMLAAQDKKNMVYVFDSLSIAGGLKLQVERAVELKKQKKTINETVEILEKEKNNVNVLFSASDMDALRRSGRVGFVKQALSNILNLVPLLKLKDGAVESVTGARGIYNFLKNVRQHLPKAATKAVVMAFDDNILKIMAEFLKKNCPDILQVEMLKPGAVLAVHLGAKSFGIAWSG